MNLRDLQYLVAVAELQHFGKAAKACFVSQPTLSAQLKKLEQYLNAQLVERSGKQVITTPVGQAIVAKAQIILQHVEDIRQIAKYASDPEAGLLRIGVIPTLGPYLLPHIVPLLRKHFPKLELLLYEDKTARILEKVKQGQLDVIILALPVENEGLSQVELFDEKFMVALSKNHPCCHKQALTLSDIENEMLLLLEDGHCLRDQALEVCSNINVKKNVGFSATSLETLRQMVAAEVGITLLPELAVELQVANQEAIVIRPFVEPQPVRSIGMLWRKTSARQETMNKIAMIIRDTRKTA